MKTPEGSGEEVISSPRPASDGFWHSLAEGRCFHLQATALLFKSLSDSDPLFLPSHLFLPSSYKDPFDYTGATW